MKIAGKTISQPYVKVLVFPRSDEPVVLEVRAILDYTPFETMIPMPIAPTRQMAGGDKFVNLEDPTFKAAVSRRGLLRHYWMSIQSLLATPGLTFDLVKLDDPDTWSLLEKELSDSGFTPYELTKILGGIMTVNGLNDDKLKEAEKDFLEKRAKGQASPLPPTPIVALRTIQSGEPANA